MRKRRRPLALNVDTIRSLTDEEAASIVGGSYMDATTEEGGGGGGGSYTSGCNNTFVCTHCDGGGPTDPSTAGACTTKVELKCTNSTGCL